ncbi:hypothetical protein OIU76_001933 [Salix suchowensis]|nr:hypothetical protein OIU76_001933 [Salix suchowensis]
METYISMRTERAQSTCLWKKQGGQHSNALYAAQLMIIRAKGTGNKQQIHLMGFSISVHAANSRSRRGHTICSVAISKVWLSRTRTYDLCSSVEGNSEFSTRRQMAQAKFCEE